MAGYEVGLICLDQIWGMDRLGAETQVRGGNRAGFLRVVNEVALSVVRGFLADDLDRVLVGSDGSVGAARSSLERAIRGWEAMGRQWEALWARLDLAGCLMRSGRFVDAASLVADVRETAQRLDSRPLLERAAAIVTPEMSSMICA